MKLIVGLGNPGKQYERTRHNVGFAVVDEVAKILSAPEYRSKFKGLLAETVVHHEKVFLLKPQTFMNLSGESVREAVSFFSELKVDADVWVAYDDMDFPVGTVKLRGFGSAGGHNGMKSIIHCLQTDAFPRIRVGVGRPQPGIDVISHVLGHFSKADASSAKEAVQRAAESIVFALENNFDAAMNQFNR